MPTIQSDRAIKLVAALEAYKKAHHVRWDDEEAFAFGWGESRETSGNRPKPVIPIPPEMEAQFLSGPCNPDQLVGKWATRVAPVVFWNQGGVDFDRSFMGDKVKIERVHPDNRFDYRMESVVGAGQFTGTWTGDGFFDGNWREVPADFPDHSFFDYDACLAFKKEHTPHMRAKPRITIPSDIEAQFLSGPCTPDQLVGKCGLRVAPCVSWTLSGGPSCNRSFMDNAVRIERVDADRRIHYTYVKPCLGLDAKKVREANAFYFDDNWREVGENFKTNHFLGFQECKEFEAYWRDRGLGSS